MFKRIVFIMLVLLMITGVAYAQPSWTQVPLRTAAQAAENLMGGEGFQNIFGISYAPSNPDILYLVSNTSQVWKSVNGGNSWQRKHRGFLPNGGISLIVHPNDPNIVFVAGTSGQPEATTCWMDNMLPGEERVSKCADGIYRTTTGGESWIMVKRTRFFDMGRKVGGVNFAFTGTNPVTIYAGTHRDGLLKSTDGGANWEALTLSENIGTTGREILDVKVHPQDSSILFIAVNRVSSADPVLYKLTNDVTLTPIENNLNTLTCNTQEPIPVARAIAIKPNPNPENPDTIIYVSMGFCGVYKSEDGGNTFIAKNNGLLPVNWSKAATYLAMSPADPNYLYVDFHEHGSNHPYYTYNGGESWCMPSVIDSGMLMYDLFPYGNINNTPITCPSSLNNTVGPGGSYYHGPIAPHPIDANIAISSLAGNHPEITTNGGDTWTYSGNGYTGGAAAIGTTSFSWDSMWPNNQGDYRFALFLVDQGPFLTKDGGNTFKALPIPRYNGAKTTPVGALDPTPNSQVIVTAVGGWGSPYITGDEQVIAVSQNEGQTWTLMDGTPGTINTNDDKYIFIAFHPQDPNIVYAGKYKSLNKGQNWSQLTKKVIAMFPGNGDIVYAAEMSGTYGTMLTISKSTDKGEGDSWTTPYDSVDIGTKSPGEIFIDPKNQDRIYVAVGGSSNTNTYYGVYIWDGSQWIKKQDADGLEKDRFDRTTVGNITVDPTETESNVVYAGRKINLYGHSNGIFASQNKGDTWKNITYNLGPEFSTWAISVNPHNERVYIGSTHGIWYLEKDSWYDYDKDGYARETDCNDNDATINPGMTEIPYNGKDDDCNPATKDDDLDGDGYLRATDCDDNDPSVNPGATEVCDNQDNDCNAGTPDGSGELWYGQSCDGPDTDLCTEGTYQCVSGLQNCSDTTGSTVDLCNGADDDCDSSSADGSEDPGVGVACDGPDSDLCQEGTTQCSGGIITCSDTTGDNIEVCDGNDNDCNGTTPDGSGESWYWQSCDGPDTDLCAEGTYQCVSGSQSCSDTTESTVDLCNGADDDCDPFSADGSEDPGVGVACDGPDSDLCQEGTTQCSGGIITCSDTTGDNDCCAGQPATIIGTAGKDTIYGTAGNDVIAGLDGNDKIYGLGGNDIICGGNGADTLYGGDGDDMLYGETGNDTLNGDSGDDALDGGANTDTCNGGTHVGGDTATNCETIRNIP